MADNPSASLWPMTRTGADRLKDRSAAWNESCTRVCGAKREMGAGASTGINDVTALQFRSVAATNPHFNGVRPLFCRAEGNPRRCCWLAAEERGEPDG